MNTSQLQGLAKLGKGISWLLSVFVAIQCGIVAVAMARVVPIFADMLKATGVELPWPTRFLLSTYQWLIPLFFVALAVLAIGKEFAIRENRRKLVVTGEVFLASVFAPGLIILILYLPLFDLIRKLKDAH